MTVKEWKHCSYCRRAILQSRHKNKRYFCSHYCHAMKLKEKIDIWLQQNQNKHYCKCGCGKFIKVKPSHHWKCKGIPKYVPGHPYKKIDYSSKYKNLICSYCKKEFSGIRAKYCCSNCFDRDKHHLPIPIKKNSTICKVCGNLLNPNRYWRTLFCREHYLEYIKKRTQKHKNHKRNYDLGYQQKNIQRIRYSRKNYYFKNREYWMAKSSENRKKRWHRFLGLAFLRRTTNLKASQISEDIILLAEQYQKAKEVLSGLKNSSQRN